MQETLQIKHLSSKLTNTKLIAYLFDLEFLYYIIYMAFTLAALNEKILYALLLVDMIKLSNDLTYLFGVLKSKLLKLFKTGLFCALVIYIYSLIGAKSLTASYTNVKSFRISS